MDSITAFDIRLDKDIYYGNEELKGLVLLEYSSQIEVQEIRVILRGKARTHFKLIKSGERKDFKDEQYFLDEKLIVWGRELGDNFCEGWPIMGRGMHQLPFKFYIPQNGIPCSLETKYGTIRYYIKVVIELSNGGSPQGIKYFTIIGPPIDCMDDKYRCALLGQNKMITWYQCCKRGALALRVILDRAAFLCGENIRILSHVENRHAFSVILKMWLVQACIEDERGKETLNLEFPVIIATFPFHKDGTPVPLLDHDVCCSHVEGGRYVSPEFRTKNDFSDRQSITESKSNDEDEIVIYRPFYVLIARDQTGQQQQQQQQECFRNRIRSSGSMISILHSPSSAIVESHLNSPTVSIKNIDDDDDDFNKILSSESDDSAI